MAGKTRIFDVDYSAMEYSSRRNSFRGFPVDFAALGFLIEKPQHGYALRSQIEEGLGPLWQVASSQLYLVLHRLEERGLARRSSKTLSSGPAKTVYHATHVGEEAFWNWVQAPVATMRNVRVEFAAKLYFLRRLKLAGVSTLIDSQLSVLEKLKASASSDVRRGSDDSTLNSVWNTLQVSTIDNFARWMKEHREMLLTEKEKRE